MPIEKAILKEFPDLNDAQKEAIGHTEGPLLVIAGPGSGKTLVLVLRTLNLLLRGIAEPEEIVLCTFTEKSAFELRDRLALLSKKLGYQGNLTKMNVGTIHGIANAFIQRYRHRTALGNNYEVLDELTQLLFIFDHFNDIVGPDVNGKYFGRWSTKWNAIEGCRDYFNKITEELIHLPDLKKSSDPFIQGISDAYETYTKKLTDFNRIDFAHQQKIFLDLLDHSDVGREIRSKIRYVMVDEYQDTNYVQEQLLLQLAKKNRNIAVVGDEDQALYRFRGGTVRNILEFEQHFKRCHLIILSVNYRSHEEIIKAYDKYMRAWPWSDSHTGKRFRYNKKIIPDPLDKFPKYPAVFSIWGTNRQDQARRFADFIAYLKDQSIIEDESQVALLLHSTRQNHSGHFIEALNEKGIPVFCPRARAYFDNDEVRYMVACYAILLGYYGRGRGELAGKSLKDLAAYVDGCITDLGHRYPDPHPLAKRLQEFAWEINNLKSKETPNERLSDYFYRFLPEVPFSKLVKDENAARNLAIFSQLLNVFQTYYHYTVITSKNREPLRFHFFHSFLRLLHEGGINEYEDPDNPMPKGYVQIMTIHQAKGLEFPVVVVGSLDVRLSSPKDLDQHLGPYYRRPPFEPQDLITGFDRMRLHYVAFSRAEKILVLTTVNPPKTHFNAICQGLPQWPYVQQNLLNSLSFNLRQRTAIRKSFSFTSDLKVYETCPRQYEFFRFYQFTPSRSAEYFFGSLVHQSIEDIHRWAMDGQASSLTDVRIRELFDQNYQNLLIRGFRPIGPVQRDQAFSQVEHYFVQNKSDFHRILETEVDVSVEKDDYILTGKIDLLLGGDGKLELLDFKSQPRPIVPDAISSYYKQLCIYAHILETRDGKRPDRLLIYWTAEKTKEKAVMSFPYNYNAVGEAGVHFDGVVKSILNREFSIKQVPEQKVCKECDLKVYCANEGL